MLNPITELAVFLRSLAEDLRRRRDHRNLLEVEALQDIQSDIARTAATRRTIAFRARCLDDEATKLLTRITAPDSPGGALIVKSEIPTLRRAMRCVRRSSEIDHQLTEEQRLAPSRLNTAHA